MRGSSELSGPHGPAAPVAKGGETGAAEAAAGGAAGRQVHPGRLARPDTNGKSLPAPRKKLLLKARYARAYREGEKWYEIRRVSDVTGLRPGDIIEVEGLGLAVVTNFVWFLSKRDFIACVGEAAKTGWKGSGVAAAQVPEDAEPPVGNEYDEAGFRELAECGITAHDFAARNVCAFNLRFLALAGAEERERVRLRRQDREERLAVAQRWEQEREAERQLAHDAARPDADLQRVNRYRHPSPPDSDDESSLLRINVASLLN